MNPVIVFLRLRWVRAIGLLVLTVLLGATLTATIYWTLFDTRWIGFLGGVLFAAVLALASQASKAQWLIARRARQIDRLREQLRQESVRSRHATDAARLADSRTLILANALPALILYFDLQERCLYHNLAFENRSGLSGDRISGMTLRELLGAAYPHVAPHLAETLEGRPARYEFAWPGTALVETYTAQHVPYPLHESPPRGFYLILNPVTAHPAPRAAPLPDQTVGDGAGESIYLRSITDQLLGWDEPRSKLERALRDNQFLLLAQTIRPLKKDLPDPRCHEILLRLKEEEDNLLPPGGFIPVAEQYGMTEQVDRWVLRDLMAWCARRRERDASWPMPMFCVNLSEAAIRNPDFARFVNYELRERGFNARALCFEIGEPEIVARHADVQRLINILKPLGCRFSADAFGSVKASFIPLKGLAFDFVKIDGVIVQNILRDPAALLKIRAIRRCPPRSGCARLRSSSRPKRSSRSCASWGWITPRDSASPVRNHWTRYDERHLVASYDR
jgi:EAL domain-containing protein (putative c-di-GMP-specific phosphodiesterase class I)/PAS domain-containing protein